MGIIMENSIQYGQKNLNILYDCDVLVVGGGFPGVCAAVGAARAGAKTVLVERNGVLGGQAAEVDTWGLDGFVDNYGKQIIRGIPWELLQRTVKEGGSDTLWTRINMDTLENKGVEPALQEIGLDAYIPYIETGTYMNPFNDQYINSNAYRYAAQCMLEEAGVEILIDMPVIDVLLEGNKVSGIVIQGEFEKFAILAKVVVDTTQQAIVCAFAGKTIAHRKIYMGTLPRVSGVDIEELLQYIGQTQEQWLLRPMAGKTAEPCEMRELVRGGNPLAIHGFETALMQAVEKDKAFEPLLRKDTSQLMFFYEHDGLGAYWTFGDNFDRVMADDPIAMSRAVLAGRKQQWLQHKFFTSYIPGFSRAQLVDTYPHISKAYEQSMEPGNFTEYDVTAKEITEGVTDRKDVILRIMGHPRSNNCPRGWLLPYGSLIPKGLDGILVTGKPACRKIHYIATCAAVGQAAGVAAAIAAISNKTVRQAEIKDILQQLENQDAIVK